MHLTGGLYAKYTAKGNGSDEARFAKFDVDIKGNGADAIDVSYTTTSDSCTINVTNDSEVAVEYTLSVSGVSGTGVVAQFDSNSGTLAPNAENPNKHILTFTVDDWSDIGEMLSSHTGEKAQISLDFTVTIDVVQID